MRQNEYVQIIMPEQNRPPSNIRKYIIWLFLCICIAGTVFWTLKILPGIKTEEKEIFAELVIAALPDGLTTAAPSVKFISARVKGPANLVNSLTDNQLKYSLNLEASGPGLKSIPLSAKHFGLPEALHITDIEPEMITLRIKTSDRKTLPVYLSIAGKPAAGFTVIDSLAVPGEVAVSGPKNLLAGMDRVMTKPITIEGIAESIKKETALDLPGGVKTIGITKAIVADIRIEEKTGRRTLAGIPVVARGTGYTAVFSPPEIILEIEGPANTLAKLDRTVDIVAYVDLTGLKQGVYVRRASISLPLSITLVKADPELFTVSLSKRSP
jgi:hypothetical protein